MQSKKRKPFVKNIKDAAGQPSIAFDYSVIAQQIFAQEKHRAIYHARKVCKSLSLWALYGTGPQKFK